MKVTIKEVAKLAGVSASTVSRVISDSPKISETTKKTVREAMEELGYFPNAIARSLVNKSTNTIGIVMPESVESAMLNPFFPQILGGIAAAAHEQDYCILLSTGTTEEDKVQSLKEIITGGRVDGVILMYSSSVADQALNLIQRLKTLAIIVGKPLNQPDISYVDNDNVEAAYNVTTSLIKKGHKKIAFMSGSFRFVVFLDRLDGYAKALMENNLEFNREYITQCEADRKLGYEKAKQLLELKYRPTALVISDDVMAIGAIEAIKEKGLKIPEEIEIISFNNIPMAEIINPSITSVDINAYTLGYEASNLLIEKIKGTSDKKKIIVPTELHVRETTVNN